MTYAIKQRHHQRSSASPNSRRAWPRAIRGLVYIGLAGQEVLTLAAFKLVLREQYVSLLLDQEAALAAIPRMLPAHPQERARALAAIRRVVAATGEASNGRAERLAQIAALFEGGATAAADADQAG